MKYNEYLKEYNGEISIMCYSSQNAFFDDIMIEYFTEDISSKIYNKLNKYKDCDIFIICVEDKIYKKDTWINFLSIVKIFVYHNKEVIDIIKSKFDKEVEEEILKQKELWLLEKDLENTPKVAPIKRRI